MNKCVNDRQEEKDPHPCPSRWSGRIGHSEVEEFPHPGVEQNVCVCVQQLKKVSAINNGINLLVCGVVCIP